MTKPTNTARIKFLVSMFGNDRGDIVRVVEETADEIYYYDSFRRYCYVNKADMGKEFEYIARGERLKR